MEARHARVGPMTRYGRRGLILDGGVTTLSHDEIISAIHKMMRRRLTPELCYLLESFYYSRKHAFNAGDFGSPVKGGVTEVTSRFAIALVEEGVLAGLRHSKHLLDEVLTVLYSILFFDGMPILNHANVCLARAGRDEYGAAQQQECRKVGGRL